MAIVGVILGGGSGLRLGGVRKGDLRLANRPLLALVHARLAPQCDCVVLSQNAAHRCAPPAAFDAVLPDLPDGPSGPAAGLWTAALWAIRTHGTSASLLSAPVDTPFLPGDFAERCLAAANPCVTAAFAGRLHPACGLWPALDLVAALAPWRGLARGPALHAIAASLGAVKLDYETPAKPDPFAGVNTLPDLLAFQRRTSGIARR
ncbi:molybdenum cofactor guanylyltransferase [Pelagibacterium montanilacus]|uniref:molybdenum cofactor guanylyltransferase n=1 Tax=Pelagibacterium montanilacus TaxID=2185280 RepID=UPI000F8C38F4|nr:NTP transferase domain-containing protein [Pelagibacterium montanilacus]